MWRNIVAASHRSQDMAQRTLHGLLAGWLVQGAGYTRAIALDELECSLVNVSGQTTYQLPARALNAIYEYANKETLSTPIQSLSGRRVMFSHPVFGRPFQCDFFHGFGGAIHPRCEPGWERVRLPHFTPNASGEYIVEDISLFREFVAIASREWISSARYQEQHNDYFILPSTATKYPLSGLSSHFAYCGSVNAIEAARSASKSGWVSPLSVFSGGFVYSRHREDADAWISEIFE